MNEITIEFVTQETTIDFVRQEITLNFECTVPGIGVPPGGDIGDVLTKIGSGDYSTSWEPPGSSASLETYTAGENLSSGRVVIIDGLEAWYFQNTDAAHAGRAYGVTKTSATVGNDVTIQVQGVIQDAAFSFTADRIVWVGADGEIFDVQPVTGVLVQKAGVAAEDKKMIIDFSIQILKN